jgi:hypothetical protein
MPAAAPHDGAAHNTSPDKKADHAADEAGGSPARKLSEDEVKQCAERLSKPIVREYELPPLIPRKVISKEGQEKSLARLYTQSLEKKQLLKNKAVEEKNKELLKPRVVAATELDGTFDRLYIQTLEMRKKNQQALETKYNPPQEGKKFTTKDEQFESAKRLCDASVEKAREVQRSLFDKYVAGTAPKFAKRTKEEIAAAVAKLTGKGG